MSGAIDGVKTTAEMISARKATEAARNRATQTHLRVLIDLRLVLDVLGGVGVAERAHRLFVVVICSTQGSDNLSVNETP
jgi:hypothetical protein